MTPFSWNTPVSRTNGSESPHSVPFEFIDTVPAPAIQAIAG